MALAPTTCLSTNAHHQVYHQRPPCACPSLQYPTFLQQANAHHVLDHARQYQLFTGSCGTAYRGTEAQWPPPCTSPQGTIRQIFLEAIRQLTHTVLEVPWCPPCMVMSPDCNQNAQESRIHSKRTQPKEREEERRERGVDEAKRRPARTRCPPRHHDSNSTPVCTPRETGACSHDVEQARLGRQTRLGRPTPRAGGR